jgi:tetratricopeptide (TPR) repeat protein
MGAVAEAFGVAWDACGAVDEAITWYERAVAADDASASLRAPEQLGNLRARRAWAQVATLDLKDAGAVAAARQAITEALRSLQTLAALSPTVERHSLCGSAWKRLSMLETRVGDPEAANASLTMAIEAYRAAEVLALATRAADLHYPALNRIVLEVARGETSAPKDADLQRVARSLAAKVGQDPDFWSLAGQVELQLYARVARGELARGVDALLQQFEQLHQRVPFARMWSSVADQADFCLGRRSQGAPVAEQKAMQELCERLRSYAGPAATDGRGAAADRPS